MSSDSKENNLEKLSKSILETNALIFIGLSVLEQNIRNAMTQLFESELGSNWLKHVLVEQENTLFLKKLKKSGEDARTLIGYINPDALKLLPDDLQEKIATLEKLL